MYISGVLSLRHQGHFDLLSVVVLRLNSLLEKRWRLEEHLHVVVTASKFKVDPDSLPLTFTLLICLTAPLAASSLRTSVSSSVSRSRASARLLEIPDSDGPDGSSRFSSPRIEVLIPKKSTQQSQPKVRPRQSNSVEDSFDEHLTDYETPATSVAVTPMDDYIASQSNRSSVEKKFQTNTKPLALRKISLAQTTSRSSSRRRRPAELYDQSLDEGRDARMAREMQAQEYGDDSAQTQNNKRKRRSRPVLDSEGSANELSIASGIGSSDDDMPLATRKRRAIPPNSRTGRRLIMLPQATRMTTEDSDLSLLDSDQFDNEDSDFASLSSAPDLDEDDDAAGLNTEAGAAGPSSSARLVSRHRRLIRASSWDPLDPRGNRARRERKKLEKAHPEVKTMWETLKAVQPIKPVAGEQPAGISRKLKSFQLEGLNWMIRQEKSQWKGGLLGDEMGMGKTIQAVSLIMSDFPAKQPTLVVVPPVALMQWQAEINSYTDGKLKVLVYHNTNPKVKHMKVKDLKAFNVIMVSYSGLESMYRKENKGWNRSDGIVKEDSVLHAIKFHRLILDEAHSIKQRTTSVARACFALKADYKWCLSGTPVQNRIGEFFSLLRFLEVVPFACYFCKSCKCKELHWSQNENKMCNHCNHSGFNHVSVFNQEILNPITQNEDPQLRKDALDKLRLVTDRIMLRRIKRDQTAAMELPPKEVIIHNEFFGEIERDFSQSVMGNSQRKFDTYVSRGVMLNNYANIFGLIMQMRQVANHPDLILKKHAEEGQNVLVCSICDEPAEEAIRSRCRHDFCRQCAKNYVRSFEGLDGDADCPRCHIPLAIDFEQPDIEQEEDHVKKSSIINRIKMEDWTSSTKIEMLIYDLYKLRSKKSTHKSIVFSQFTSMLQLVEWRLRRAGFNTVMLDGSMSPVQRQRSIEHFMNNVEVEVFLVSLKAGGVALNLTEASRVFIVDP
jgi:DNA repair protein RAD16